MATASPPLGLLAHHDRDSVAVAVRDLKPGTAEGNYLRGSSSLTIVVLEPVPLGHKVALTDIAAGHDVIEYGERIGVATRDISQGGHVHVDNVRSARWQNSVA